MRSANQFHILVLTFAIMGMTLWGCGPGDYNDLMADAVASSESGKAEITSEQRTILTRMGARERDFLRNYKEELSIGETYDGLISELDEPSAAMEDPDYAEQVRQIIIEENNDRNAYYKIEVSKYLFDATDEISAEVNKQVDQELAAAIEKQRSDITQKAEEQVEDDMWFCSKLLFWLDCDAIEATISRKVKELVKAIIDVTGEQISSAKERVFRDAMEFALDQCSKGLVLAVQDAHAEYWQDKWTKSGEWIQTQPDVWQLKP